MVQNLNIARSRDFLEINWQKKYGQTFLISGQLFDQLSSKRIVDKF